jgi:hypothetical protein
MAPYSYFSDDYQAARRKFLAACEAAGAGVESHRNQHAGPDGAPLFTDVGTIGAPDARAALVLGSGTHGVEGFAGSGIQTGLLSDGLGSRVPRGVRVMMIHAINPYGFAHLRRVNEDNVDLNRNFVDHSSPHPANDEYGRLAHAIAPASQSSLARLAASCQIASYRFLRGKRALQAAVSRGQYSHEQGLFYGGRFETWSNRTLRSIIQGSLQGMDRLAFVDFHTGLGAYGQGELILNEVKTSSVYDRAVTWWGERVKSTKEGESVSVDLEGTLKLAISRMLPDVEITGGSLEFGTYPPMEVFRAMKAENWLHHHGGAPFPQADRIKARFRRAFYPDADEWKVMVWEQARAVVEQALDGLDS